MSSAKDKLNDRKFLIVGLGNPGKEYENTRHNLGYLVLDYILKQQKSAAKSSSLLLKPNRFMNSSGESVKAVANYHKISPLNILVVHDDVDLELGKVKIAFGASSAGHRGVQSVIDCLGTKDFWRARVGVGRPRQGQNTDSYVLARFSSNEKKIISRIVDETAKKVLASVDGKSLKEETFSVKLN